MNKELRSALERLNHALANAQEWYISDPEDSEIDRDAQMGNWIERAFDEVKNMKELLDPAQEDK